MKKMIMTVAGLSLALGVSSAFANPDADRAKMVSALQKANPEIQLNEYVYGALAYDADSKSQYESIMDFPPYLDVIDKGEKMWKTPFKNGKTYASCFPNGGKNVAGNYPMFDNAKGKVVTFEDAVNDCRTSNGEEAYDYSDMKTIGTLTAYARTLSDGMTMNIKVEGAAAQKAFDDGKATYYARKGQLNFSCASCHLDNAGNRVRSELLSPTVGQATHWPVFRGGSNLFTLQKRFAGCNKSVRQVPDKPGSTRYNNLEYFVSYMSNGMPMKASVFRK